MQGQQIRDPLGAALQPWASENAPTLSPNQRGRYGPTEALNYFHIIGTTSASTGWESIHVDRPTILRPATQLSGMVFCHPGVIPHRNGGAFDAEYSALLGAGPGVIYLWAPGIWWIKYHASGGYARFLRIPCEDPALAAMVMSEPGYMVRTEGSLSAALANTSEQLVAANNWRRGICITLASGGTAYCAISLGGTASLTPTTVAGLVLSGRGGSLTLTGASNYKGAINIACNLAAVDVTYVEWT